MAMRFLVFIRSKRRLGTMYLGEDVRPISQQGVMMASPYGPR
jgi:hypothetical protein